MATLDIEILRDYMTKFEVEIKEEEDLIGERIEKEYERFFSRYQGKDIPESLRNEYRESVKQILLDKLNRKKLALDEIVGRIGQLEQKYQTI